MPKLTPTQELLLDTLAARTRLGENLWTFHSRHTKPLAALEQAGLVTTMHGVTEHSIRASLTDTGRDEVCSDTYASPLEKRARIAEERVRVLTDLVGAGR